jgi:hypothetical protein
MFQTQTSSHQYGSAKFVLRQGLRGWQCSSPTFLEDLQHIYHPRSNSRCGMHLPLSIFIIRKSETMVLFQQGGSVNLGEMLQCISRQVFFVGQDQCPSKEDLYLSISQGCHISCDKFSSRTSNLNLCVWRWSYA